MADIQIHQDAGEHVIFDRDRIGRYDPAWFDPALWQAEGTVVHSTKGRGSVLKRSLGSDLGVLRHYHRGGLVSKLVYDHYWWSSAESSRSFREWRLLRELHERAFPVPEPLAARAVRRGPLYQADILLAYLPETRTLTAHLNDGALTESRWREIGALVRGFHDYGVDHPDLTAHNILLDADGRLYLVDFDNAAVRPRGAWQAKGLERLQRSLRKVAMETGTQYDADAWAQLQRGYAAHRASGP